MHVMHMSPPCISTGGLKKERVHLQNFVLTGGLSKLAVDMSMGGPTVTGTPVVSRTD